MACAIDQTYVEGVPRRHNHTHWVHCRHLQQVARVDAALLRLIQNSDNINGIMIMFSSMPFMMPSKLWSNESPLKLYWKNENESLAIRLVHVNFEFVELNEFKTFICALSPIRFLYIKPLYIKVSIIFVYRHRQFRVVDTFRQNIFRKGTTANNACLCCVVRIAFRNSIIISKVKPVFFAWILHFILEFVVWKFTQATNQ